MAAARTILHTGPGGAGTAVVAAASARRCAASGLRTLLVSADPEHALEPVLGSAMRPNPTPGADGVWALGVDPRTELERRWSTPPAWVTAGPLPPGAFELAAGLVVAEQAAADWDVVMVDCGPTAQALRLVALPELARSWLAGGRAAHPPLGDAGAPSVEGVRDPVDGAAAIIGGAARTLLALDDVLGDPERCSVRLVVRPEATAATPARRAAAAFELHGVVLDAVIVPGARDAVSELVEALVPVPVLTAPEDGSGPPEALDGLGAALWADVDAATVLHVGVGLVLEVGRVAATLRVELPHAERSELSLRRVDGLLAIGVREHRRAVPLPAAVADYRPAGARFADGVLQVDFTPASP